VYRLLVWNSEGKKPLAGNRRRREDNIKVDHQEVRWGMHWINLAKNSDRGRHLYTRDKPLVYIK